MSLNKNMNTVLTKIPGLDIFSTKKLIRNAWMNKMGLQPFRVRLAEKRYALRPDLTSEEVKEYIDILQRDGVVVIENLLSDEAFATLESECLQALSTVSLSKVRQDGPNQYTNIQHHQLTAFPALQKMFNHPLVEAMFRAAERRPLKLSNITRLLERLVQGPDNGTQDPETSLHEDTFHNTFKAWLYITDVELENGPFVYVPQSHDHEKADRFTKVKAYSLAKNSIHSRRIPKEELAELGLEEKVFRAKKNTFVMANTLGFHRRLRGQDGNERISIAFSARYNPFL